MTGIEKNIFSVDYIDLYLIFYKSSVNPPYFLFIKCFLAKIVYNAGQISF